MDLGYSGFKVVKKGPTVPIAYKNFHPVPYYISDSERFGRCGRPHGAWQIDPFGHSKTQAELFALMGYDSVYFARMDYQEYAHRNASKTIEMLWRGNDDFPKSRDLFSGGLFSTSYGPPPGFSWFRGFDDDPIIDDPYSEEYNVESRVNDFMKQVERYQAKRSEFLLF